MSGTPAPDRAGGRRALGDAGLPLQVALGVLCPAGIMALFGQYVDVYLTFFGATPEATSGDEALYLVTAITSIVIAVAGVAVALMRRRIGASLLALMLLGLVLVTAVLFAVPRGRWDVTDLPHPVNPNYQPCYSGSNDCVGG